MKLTTEHMATIQAENPPPSRIHPNTLDVVATVHHTQGDRDDRGTFLGTGGSTAYGVAYFDGLKAGEDIFTGTLAQVHKLIAFMKGEEGVVAITRRMLQDRVDAIKAAALEEAKNANA